LLTPSVRVREKKQVSPMVRDVTKDAQRTPLATGFSVKTGGCSQKSEAFARLLLSNVQT